MTGRDSNVPAFVTATDPAGGCAGRVNGTVNGGTTPISDSLIAFTNAVFSTVPYLRGSGQIAPMVNVTDTRSVAASLIRPDRRR